MATSLADPAAAQGSQPPPAPAPDSAQPLPAEAGQRSCLGCGAPLAGAQDWCLQCGTGAPGSLDTTAPGWRSAAAVGGAIALLVAGAATAGYAALSKSPAKPRAARTLAQAPPPTAATPGAVPPATPGAVPPATPKIGPPATVKPLVPLSKPPKIPLTAATPKTSATTAPPVPAGGTTTSTPTKTSAGGKSTSSSQQQPAAIVLDTNAAATYNPSGYPAGNFGDPSLAIDGEPSTGWTAQVDPAVAPRMAVGLVIDLKTPQKLAALALRTSTPGIAIQVYGANGPAAPASITDPAWVRMSRLLVDKKRHVRIALSQPRKSFRFIALWISKVPASAIGTAQAPGRVSVNELELFPPAK